MNEQVKNFIENYPAEIVDMFNGLRQCFEWYLENQDKVNKKPYFEFIDENLIK